MEQESGVLRKSLLSFKKELFPDVQSNSLIAYKHYLLTFDQHRNQDRADCVVFDTEKGTSAFVNSGLNLPERVGYSFCHWKDNVFVLYGGEYYGRPDEDPTTQRNRGQDLRVHFLSVIENDGQISFTVESCDLTDPQWWDIDHSAHIYQDNMYVFGSEAQSANEIIKKFDLNERTWTRSEATGDIPKPCYTPITVRINNKIYFFGGWRSPGGGRSNSRNTGGLFGGGGGGLFGNRGGHQPQLQSKHDLFLLDLGNMEWQKVQTEDFIPASIQKGIHAERVGDKIYISHNQFNEFFIYDTANNKLLKSDGFPPKKNWRIRTFENQSIIFRMYLHVDDQAYIKYQNIETSTQPEQQEKKVSSVDPLVATTQQLPHMEFIWKEKLFADVTFVVQNEEIPAHRVILFKCRYFQNMFKSGMIETTSQKINVPEISPTNFKAILEYIYCDKIDLTESLTMELIVLADMYFLPNLKADCEKYLSEKLSIANFVEVMKVAQTADSEKLEKRVINFLTSNIEKVREEVDIRLIPPELFIKAIIDVKPTKKK